MLLVQLLGLKAHDPNAIVHRCKQPDTAKTHSTGTEQTQPNKGKTRHNNNSKDHRSNCPSAAVNFIDVYEETGLL